MCGIVGIWARHGAPGHALRDDAIRMTRTLSHRGPDDEGIWLDQAAGLALGHRRLSVIDLSPSGHQPMTSANQRFIVCYNGEVYNFRALRSELEARGTRLRGTSDTEVIAEFCAAEGVAATLQRLNGMFALAIWDTQTRTLSLARDRMGEKPLYFAAFGPLVLFGSELKALLAHPGCARVLSRDAVPAFLRHGYVPGPFSIYEGIRKLAPGGLVTVGQHGEPVETRYWQLADAVRDGHAAPLPVDEREASAALDALLADSVRSRMVSDVPIGAFLSGGYDSSLIVALMQEAASTPVRTFTVRFEESGFDEAPFAAAVARHLGTNHTALTVTGAEAREAVPRLPTMYDEPFADPSQIPTALLSALTRRHVTVALSGDGGDELFTGYDRYRWAERIWQPFAHLPPATRRAAAGVIRAVPLPAYRGLERLAGARRAFQHLGSKAQRVAALLVQPGVDAVYRGLVSAAEAPGAFVPTGCEVVTPVWHEDLRDLLPDAVDRMRYRDMLTYLPDDILTKVDRASMAASLEVRTPFLDHRLVEFVWRLPPSLNAHARRPKHLPRLLLDRRVPPSLTQRPKMGFGIPLGDWLRGPLRDWAGDLLSPALLRQDQVIAPAPVEAVWRDLQSGSNRHQHLAWNILMFQAWQQTWRIPAAPAAAELV